MSSGGQGYFFFRRNRSPIENDGQRAKCGGTRWISGGRMVSRPPGGQSRGVSSPGFPRPSGFGHPGLCLSRPPGGHRQSSLPAAVWWSRPPGGQSRGVSSPGFPRPSGFGHPGLCLSRPPGGHRQSSLPAAVWWSRLICRASCQDDDTIPWRNSQWVTGDL
jgi:hypothetical protein